MRVSAFFGPVAAALLFASACSRQPSTETKTEAPPKSQAAEAESSKAEPAKAARIPDIFQAKFETSKGDFIIEVHRDWAPLGAERFYELVQDGFYNNARFFRVVPNFVVQFGLAADPAMTKKWDKQIPDDPVLRTNGLGSVTFATAGPNTRTTQVFINLRSNQFLDNQGFAPFGRVIEGMEVVQRIYSGYGERPDQGEITARGNAYLTAHFPNLDYIRRATIQ